MARLLLILLSFIAVFPGTTQAKDIYYIGFLGNSTNASSQSLYNALSLTCENLNNTWNAYDINTVFFNEDSQSAADDIKGTGNLIAVLGCFAEKHAALIDKIDSIPLISICRTYPGFNEKNRPNVFRTCPTGAQLAAALSRFAITVLVKDKFGIVYSTASDEYIKAAEAFAANAKKNRVWAEYFKDVAPDRMDFTNILLRLRDIKAQAIFFAGSMEQSAELSRKSKEMNVGAVFIGTDEINSRAFIKKAKDGSDGACFALVTPPSLYALKKLRPFLEQYGKRWENQDMYMPFVYDAAGLLAKCLASGAGNGRDIIKCLKDADYDGATGEISFAENGNRKSIEPYFYIIARKEIFHRKLMEGEIKKYQEAK